MLNHEHPNTEAAPQALTPPTEAGPLLSAERIEDLADTAKCDLEAWEGKPNTTDARYWAKLFLRLKATLDAANARADALREEVREFAERAREAEGNAQKKLDEWGDITTRIDACFLKENEQLQRKVAELEEPARWRDAATELPELGELEPHETVEWRKSKLFEVITKGGDFRKAYLRWMKNAMNPHKWLCLDGSWVEVTHYRPLPELPQENHAEKSN